MELQEWDFDLEYRKGALNHVPDALSRGIEVDEEVAAFEEITDEWYLRMLRQVEDCPKKYPNWCINEGILYRKGDYITMDLFTSERDQWKMVVPAEHQARVLNEAHSDVTAGHMGIEKTYARLTNDYYWRGMWCDVNEFVRSCVECQQYKASNQGQQGLMGDRIVEEPWRVVAGDFMEFPASKTQNKYLLVLQDLFTRWIEVKAMRTADGKGVAKALEDLVIFRWGTPDYFLSDNGKEFDNKYLRSLLEEYGIRHVTTPPYHPQANPVERTNRTLKTMISTFVAEDHRNWDMHIHEFRNAVNTAFQTSLKTSPAFLNFGRNPHPVHSLRREVEETKPIGKISPEDWEIRMRRLEALRDLVRKNLDVARERQRKAYDKGRKDVRFNVGDLVLRKVHVLSSAINRFNAKLAPKYDGPYRVEEILSPTVYVLSTDSAKRVAKAHVSEIKRYVPPRGNVREEDGT